MASLRSVLFVDFDNIFGGLMELDRTAGLAFARQPQLWLDRLSTYGLADEGRRRFLQCRTYLNPAGRIKDPELGNDAGWLYLQKFRPNLTRAGFEVIDCPTLTLGQKNAADIRIVIDVLSSLGSQLPFDEFIIASSDADFTPLLHRLRAHDRRIVVISAGNAAPSYHSVADDFIGPEALISFLLSTADNLHATSTSEEVTLSAPADMPTNERAERHVLDQLRQSDTPLYLAHVGKVLRAGMGDVIDETAWYGHGGLTAFLRNIDGGRLRVDNLFVWDPERHDPPDEPSTGANSNHLDLPDVIQDLRAVTDLPALPSQAWPRLFEALADYAQHEEFSLTACTASVRDALRHGETPVSRGAVGFVVRGMSFRNVRLTDDPPPSAETMRQAFQANIVDRSEASGSTLSTTQLAEVDLWFRGQDQ